MKYCFGVLLGILLAQECYARAFTVTMSAVPASYSASDSQSRILTSLGKVKNVCCYNPSSSVVAASFEGTASVAPSNDSFFIPAGFGACRDVRGTAFYIRGRTGTITSGEVLLCDYTLAQ